MSTRGYVGAARAHMLEMRRLEQVARVPRFTPMPARPNLSTRGERGKPWLTKKHTPARKKAMQEARAALKAKAA
jgi:hypothetical protein